MNVPPFSLLRLIWKYIKSGSLKIYNWVMRPKLVVDFRVENFEFTTSDNIPHHIQIPHIAVKNNKSNIIQIKANKISFNNTLYIQMHGSEILRELYDTKGAKETKISKSEIMYVYYKNNWLDITEGRALIEIEQGNTKIFPIMLLGAAISSLQQEKESSRLFLNSFKMSFTLHINGKNFEYGINRKYFYERYLNYLASHTARYKPAKYI